MVRAGDVQVRQLLPRCSVKGQHLSGPLPILIKSARKDDLRVICQLADAEIMELAIVWQSRQSCLDGLGGVVKAGVLVGLCGAALLDHDHCIPENHGTGRLEIQAGILDEASFLCESIVQHQRFDKFSAIRECESIVARNQLWLAQSMRSEEVVEVLTHSLHVNALSGREVFPDFLPDKTFVGQPLGYKVRQIIYLVKHLFVACYKYFRF